jgi:hypothetical protein
MRDVAGSTPGLDFYILCEPIYVSLRLFHYTLYNQLVFDHALMRRGRYTAHAELLDLKYLVVVWFTRGFLTGY